MPSPSECFSHVRHYRFDIFFFDEIIFIVIRILKLYNILSNEFWLTKSIFINLTL